MVVVGTGGLARDYGAVSRVAVPIPLENKANLLLLGGISEVAGPKKDTHLEGHIEPRKVVDGIEFGSGDVVDAVLAFGHHPEQRLRPYNAPIIDFQCTASHETAIVAGKNQGIKKGRVVVVKRAVDEHAFPVGGTSHNASLLVQLRRALVHTGHRLGDLGSAVRLDHVSSGLHFLSAYRSGRRSQNLSDGIRLHAGLFWCGL